MREYILIKNSMLFLFVLILFEILSFNLFADTDKVTIEPNTYPEYVVIFEPAITSLENRKNYNRLLPFYEYIGGVVYNEVGEEYITADNSQIAQAIIGETNIHTFVLNKDYPHKLPSTHPFAIQGQIVDTKYTHKTYTVDINKGYVEDPDTKEKYPLINIYFGQQGYKPLEDIKVPSQYNRLWKNVTGVDAKDKVIKYKGESIEARIFTQMKDDSTHYTKNSNIPWVAYLTYITSTTRITLTAIDQVVNSELVSGVSVIYYSIDVSIPNIIYTGPFVILDEGCHTVYYRSVDNAGNIEVEKSITLILDNTSSVLSVVTDKLNLVIKTNRNLI